MLEVLEMVEVYVVVVPEVVVVGGLLNDSGFVLPRTHLPRGQRKLCLSVCLYCLYILSYIFYISFVSVQTEGVYLVSIRTFMNSDYLESLKVTLNSEQGGTLHSI